MGHNENKIYSNLLRIIIHDFSGCDTTSKQNQETLNEETTNDNLLPNQDSLPQFKVAQQKEETFMIKGLEMREIFDFFSLKAHPSMNMVAEEKRTLFCAYTQV